jgi:DNA repair exonuclease SbcCD ATPase subunit
MNTQSNTNNELLTLKTVSDLTKFLTAIDTADNAETTRFYETEKAISLLKILRGQYTTLQHGNATCEAGIGELPNCIYKPVIQALYDGKKQTAEIENREFTLQFEGYRDNQVRQLKYYIETGELFNRKKETQQEKALANIAKLDAKLAAEKKKAEKLAAEKAEAEKAKAEAEAEAEKAKAEAEKMIDDVHEFMDTNPQGADAIKDELFDVIDDAEAVIAEAELAKVDATKAAEKAKAEAEKAEAEAENTEAKLEKAKNRLANLTAGKASNTQTDPKLDFKTMNFSKDCKDTAISILESLETHDLCSAPELLYLAKLILDKYNK